MYTTFEAIYDPKTGLKFSESIEFTKPASVGWS